MAKKQRPHQDRKSATESSSKRKAAQAEEMAAVRLLDAVAEIVHLGFGYLFDEAEAATLFGALNGWKPNCCMNYEYVFAWNPVFNIHAIEINWQRPNQQILRRVVKRSVRRERILSGSPMTVKEQMAYRLELARRKHGYLSAQEHLEADIDCKWVDLLFVNDSKGRDVFILEMGDALSNKNESVDSIIDRLDEIWQWKTQGLSYFGPFASEEEAEIWMTRNGAFEDV